MRGVHFTILPASPCAADFYEFWHTRSTHRRNHVCQIFSRSVQGLWSSDTSKLPFPIDLLRRPYNSVVLPCDTVMMIIMLQHSQEYLFSKMQELRLQANKEQEVHVHSSTV